MARGIMIVETWPNSPEETEAYHRWYTEVHIPELLGIEGIVSARRFEPVEGGPPWVAIYEIEADDILEVQARQQEATRSGRTTRPVGVRMDPFPTVRWMTEIGSYTPKG